MNDFQPGCKQTKNDLMDNQNKFLIILAKLIF